VAKTTALAWPRHHRCAGEQYVPGVEQFIGGTRTRLTRLRQRLADNDRVVDTDAERLDELAVRRNMVALREHDDVPGDELLDRQLDHLAFTHNDGPLWQQLA
jgi:hypothetical protein